MSKPGGLFGCLDIKFPLGNLLPRGSSPFPGPSFPVMSIFVAFEALHGFWDILFNPLETIGDFHFLGSKGLVKCQDVGVGLDLFYPFSNGDSSDALHSLFSQGC